MDLMQKIYDEIASSLFRSATSIEAMEEFLSLSGMRKTTQQSSINPNSAGLNVNLSSVSESNQPQSSGPNRKARRSKNLKKDKDIIIKLYPHMINFRKK